MPRNTKNTSSVPLSTRIEEELLQYIKDNKFETGDKLPNEATLSKTFSVGRSSLREATSRLVSRGVLEVRQGSGTFILDPIPSDKDPLGLRFEKDESKISKDLFELLSQIEPFLCAKAAMNATPENIKEIEKVSKSEVDSIEFHSLIAKASNNCLSENLIKLLYSTTSFFDNRIMNKSNDSEYREYKKRIITAFKNKDELLAKMSCQSLLNAMYIHSLEK